MHICNKPYVYIIQHVDIMSFVLQVTLGLIQNWKLYSSICVTITDSWHRSENHALTPRLCMFKEENEPFKCFSFIERCERADCYCQCLATHYNAATGKYQWHQSYAFHISILVVLWRLHILSYGDIYSLEMQSGEDRWSNWNTQEELIFCCWESYCEIPLIWIFRVNKHLACSQK